MKLSVKLTVGFLVMILLVVAAGARGYLGMVTISDASDDLALKASKRQHGLRMRITTLATIDALRDTVQGRDASVLDRTTSSMDMLRAELDYLRTKATEQETELIQSLSSVYSELEEAFEKVRDLVFAERWEEAADALELEIEPTSLKLESLVIQLDRQLAKDMETSIDDVAAIRDTATLMLIGLIVVTIGIGTMLGMGLTRNITGPIHRLILSTERIAAGDLSHQVIGVKSRDEVGQLATAFNIMTDKLRESYKRLKERAEELATINEITSTVTSTLDLQQVFELVMQKTREAFGVERGSLLLLDEERKELTFAWTLDGRDRELEGFKIKVGQGIVGHVVQTGQPLIVYDVEKDPRYYAEVGRSVGFATRSILCVPLIVKDRVIGAIELMNKLEGRFNQDDVDRLNAVAASVAIAIENARLYSLTDEQLSERLEELTALEHIGRELNATLELESILNVVLDESLRVTSATHGDIVLLDQDSTSFQVTALRGYTVAEEERLWTACFGEGPSVTDEVIRSGRPEIIPDVVQEARPVCLKPQTRSALVVPIFYEEAVVGSINLRSTQPQAFDQDDLDFVQALAAQAAIAIGNARRYEEQVRRGEALRHRTEQMSRLFEIGHALRMDQPLERILEDIAYAIQETVGFNIALIGLVEEEPSPQLQWVATAGVPLSDFQRLSIRRRPLAHLSTVMRDEFRVSQSYLIPHGSDICWEKEAEIYALVEDQTGEGEGQWHPADALLVPLRGTEEQILGLLSVDNPRDGQVPSPSTIEALETFATQAAMAIENVRLYEEMKSAQDRLSRLYEISISMSGQLDLDLTIQLILEALASVGYDKTMLSLVNKEMDIIEAKYAVGEGMQKIVEETRRDLDGPDVLAIAVREGEAVVIEDSRVDPRCDQRAVQKSGVVTQVVLPLTVRDEVIGTVQVASMDKRRVSDAELELLMTFANQAAQAIENARLYAASERRVAELTALHQIAVQIGAQLNLQTLLSQIARSAAELLSADAGAILLLDEEGETLTIKGTFGLSEKVVKGTRDRVGESIAGRVVQIGKPIIANDIPNDPRFYNPSAAEEGLLAIVSTPMFVRNRIIGTLDVHSKTQRQAFNEDHLRILSLLANQAAIAIENVGLYREAKVRADEMAALYETSLNLASQLEVSQLLQSIVERAAGLLKAKGGAIYTYDEAKDDLELTLSYNLGEDLTGTRLKRGEGLSGKILKSGEPMIVADYRTWEGRSEKYSGQAFTAVIGVPLKWSDRIIGVINITDDVERAFSDDDLRLLNLFANQAAVAIENAQLYQEIKDFSLELEQRVQERTEELARANQELTLERDHVETLYRITSELSASLDLDRILTKALALVNEAVGVRHGSIMLLDAETGYLIHRAALGRREPLPRGGKMSRYKPGVGLAGWVIENRKAVTLEDVSQDERWVVDPEEEAYGRSAMAVPLASGEDILGVLLLSHPQPGYFSQAHLRLVSAAATQVSTAINNAELYRLIRDQAERLGTMLRAQQAESSKSRAILEGIADGVLVSDSRGEIILLNAAAGRILGIESERITGRSVHEGARYAAGAGLAVRGLSLVSEWMTRLPLHLRQEPELFEARFEVGERVINVRIAPVMMQDEFLGAVALFRDITKEVEVDRLKSEFISTVSHELRTPMTSIKGYTDLLFLEAAGRVNESQRHFLNIIKSNADRLSFLVNDLLDISRIETGRVQLDIKPLQIGKVIDEVVTSLEGQVQEKHLGLSVDVPEGLPMVQGDRDRIAQILFNLVTNAYQYTPEGGQITISVRPEDGALRVDVSDTGIGIAPEDQQRIFDRFYRADHPVVRESNGTGLGLSIVKSFVEMHGGEIWVESELGHGSTFSFTLLIADSQ